MSQNLEEFQDSRQPAWQLLIRRLAKLSKIEEGDLFATFFLARHYLYFGDYDKAMTHVLGCSSIMKHLSSTAGKMCYRILNGTVLANDQI